MAILVECDVCGNQHRVKDGLVGTCIRCKDCGTEIEVLAINRVASSEFFEENGRLFRREQESPAPVWPWILVGIVSGLIVLILAAAIWAFLFLFRVDAKPVPNRLEPVIHFTPQSCEFISRSNSRQRPGKPLFERHK